MGVCERVWTVKRCNDMHMGKHLRDYQEFFIVTTRLPNTTLGMCYHSYCWLSQRLQRIAVEIRPHPHSV